MIQRIFAVVAVVLFSGITVIAHVVAPKDYDWRINTISELASQGYGRKWIMQLGLMTYGSTLSFGIIHRWVTSQSIQLEHIPVLLYAVSIAF